MYVYILESSVDQSHYVGISDNPERRLEEHNAGKVNSTQQKKPWRKIYQEEYASRLDTRQREKYLKSAAGRRFRSRFRAISSAG